MTFHYFPCLRDTIIVKYRIRLLAFVHFFGLHSGLHASECCILCEQCQDVNRCFQMNDTCLISHAADKQHHLNKTGEENSRTTLIALLSVLSALLITTWLLIAICALLKRRRGRLQLNETGGETRGASVIRTGNQRVSQHYDEILDSHKDYMHLDLSAQETHYEDVNKTMEPRDK